MDPVLHVQDGVPQVDLHGDLSLLRGQGLLGCLLAGDTSCQSQSLDTDTSSLHVDDVEEIKHKFAFKEDTHDA